MQLLTTALFLVAAIINLAPVTGVLSTDRLQALYGIPVDGADLEILLRHRAVLFGIVGAFLLVAAFHAPLRPLATAVGLVSMLSYLVIALSVGGYNAELQRVVVVDLVGAAALIGGAVLSSLYGER